MCADPEKLGYHKFTDSDIEHAKNAKAYLDCIYVSAFSALLTFFVPYGLALGVFAFFLALILYFEVFKKK